MSAAVERRYTPVPVEVRTGRQDRRSIGGYAATFNRQSRNLGGFVEQLDAAVFNKPRADGWPDVRARYNHEDLIGTTAAGTLRLQVDGTGLLYEVDPPDSRGWIVELIERGDVRHSSFAFRTVADEWAVNDQGYPLRTLHEVKLVDVAPVDDPAYRDTTAGLRSLDGALESLAAHVQASVDEVRACAEADELRRYLVRTDVDGGRVKPARLSGAAAVVQLQAMRDDLTPTS